jgi:hypothetical protein
MFPFPAAEGCVSDSIVNLTPAHCLIGRPPDTQPVPELAGEQGGFPGALPGSIASQGDFAHPTRSFALSKNVS